MSKFPAIPDVSPDQQSILTAIRAMKDIIERLSGQRQGASLGAPLIFVQSTAPLAGRNVILSAGDQWINSATDVMSYWTGAQWKALA